MNTLQSGLISLYKRILKQRAFLKKEEKNYESAVNKYFDASKIFGQDSEETITRFESRSQEIGMFEGKLESYKDDPKQYKKLKRQISKFKSIEPLVNELLKKGKSFRETNNKMLEHLNQTRNEVRYLDQQFMHINKMKKVLMHNNSNKYVEACVSRCVTAKKNSRWVFYPAESFVAG